VRRVPGKRQRCRSAVAVIIALALGSAAAIASPKSFSIDAEEAPRSLLEFGRQSSLQVLFESEKVKGIITNTLHGNYEPIDALRLLLKGTPLAVSEKANGVLVVEPQAKAQKALSEVPLANAKAPSPSALDQSNTTNAQSPLGSVSAQSTALPSSPPPEDDKTALAEVVVTAQKRAENILSVPMGITALDADDLRRAGVDTILSLSYSVPSLVVESTSDFNRYFIRGIGNSQGGPLIGVYLDEADVTAGSLTQLALSAVDLQRVEVLKGPQGTLYGAGSAGGTVRYITNDPDLTHFAGSGDLQFYSTRYGEGSQEFSGVLNLPLVPGDFGVRIAGTIGNLGGWIDQPAASRTDINNQNLRDIRIKTLWTPTDALSLKTLVVVNRNNGNGNNESEDRNYDLSLAVEPALKPSFTANYDIYNLTATYTFPTVSLLSSTTYSDQYTSDITGEEYEVSPPPGPLFQFLTNPEAGNSHSFSEELRVSSVAATPYHWLAGAFYKDSGGTSSNQYEYSFGGPVLGDFPAAGSGGSKSVSTFADGGYDLTSQWEAGGGVRYFHEDQTSFDGVTLRSGSFHDVTPRLYTSYAVTTDIHTYADVADGFRSGGFNGGSGLPETTFAPEKVRSYEMGTKASLFDHSVTADIALFFSRYTNMQYFATAPNGVGTVFNAGTSHIWGVDWAFDWQATEHLLLSLNGNVTRTRLVSLIPGVTIVDVGDPVDFSTDYSGRVAATYAWDLTQRLPAFVHVQFARVGPSHLTDRSEGGDPILFESDVINMLDARIGVSRSNWSVALFGENLANANGQQDAGGAYGFSSRPRPRTFGVDVHADF
jgi:iron complex outermembrane receptor protein